MNHQVSARSQARREPKKGESAKVSGADPGASAAAHSAIGFEPALHPQSDLLTEALRRWAWEGGALDRPSE